MKIAVIQRFLPSRSRGGAGFFAHGLCNALVKRGHAVTVWTQHPKPSDALYETKILPVSEEIQKLKLDPFVFPFDIAKQDFSGYDVLHAQGDDQWIPRRFRPKAVVRTLHASSLSDAVHNGWSLRSPKLFFMYLYFYVWEIQALLRADLVTAVSSEVCKHYPRIDRVIGNGIDASLFRAQGPKAPRPVLLFVGQMFTRKRGWLVLKAFKEKIRPALPEAELWLVTPEKTEEPGVRWFGPQDQEQLAELYPKAWVFCLPSSSEGFGRGYVEAMLSGTAAAATPNPGSVEIFNNGEFGMLAKEEELGEALLRLLSDGTLREKYRQLGLVRGRKYAWDNVVCEYEEVYEKALAKK